MKRVMEKMGIIQEKKTIPTIHECVYYLTQNKLNKNILPKELKRSYSTELEILQLAYQTDNNGGNELDHSLWTPLHRYIVFRKNIIADISIQFMEYHVYINCPTLTIFGKESGKFCRDFAKLSLPNIQGVSFF